MKTEEHRKLSPYMSPAGTFAFSIGASIGWGSFVVTCSTHLVQAGPVGTALGLIFGMLMILLVGNNLQYMICSNPDAGGMYAYCQKVNGSDHGFLVAWFLLLVYSALLWANITSLPLFARYFLGDLFRFGLHYQVFGYDVYLGNSLLSIGALVLVGLLCARSRKMAQRLMILGAGVFICGIAVVLLLCLMRHGNSGFSFAPAYIPETNELNQILRIAIISPWAFIGFENVAQFSEEFDYPVIKVRSILVASIVLTTVVYLMMTLLSITAYPPEYSSWLAYLSDVSNLEGVKGVPAFYAAQYYLGRPGIGILLISLFGVIFTSIVAHLTALSRLLFALSRDGMLPPSVGRLNEHGLPGKAILVSCIPAFLVTLLGRTAIGWMVDVTTLGATILYAFLSYAVFRDAYRKKDRREQISGMAGFVVMAVFVMMLLAPEITNFNAMATESYFLFTVWAVVGLIVFQFAMGKDEKRRYGRSLVVWIILLMLVMFTCLVWTRQRLSATTDDVMEQISAYYINQIHAGTVSGNSQAFFDYQKQKIIYANTTLSIEVFAMFLFSVWVMTSHFRHVRRWEREDSIKLGTAEKIANTDPLTGVKSKNAYLQTEREMDEQIETGTMEDFAVVLFDINDLKIINDTQGHAKGDELIQDASRLICDIFAHSPVFRIGGDEFVAVLRGSDYENRNELFRQLNRKVEENLSSSGPVVSAGMSDYVIGQDVSTRSVFEQADHRMYLRKREMKSRAGKEMRSSSMSAWI